MLWKRPADSNDNCKILQQRQMGPMYFMGPKRILWLSAREWWLYMSKNYILLVLYVSFI